MSRELPSRRIAFTGWSLGWRDGESWLENDATSTQFLRASYGAGKLLAARDATAEWEQLRNSGHTRFDSATRRAVSELSRIGLLQNSELALPPQRVAVCFSSSKGELALLQKTSNPANFLRWLPNVPAQLLSTHIGAKGTVLSPVAACATGSHAVAIGAQVIHDGYADAVVCGATEMGLTPLVMAAYSQLGALSKTNQMRPFCRTRDGFVPQEGIALLVLEREDTARTRGAQILGYISGWSMRCDATSMTAMSSSGDTIALAIEDALRRAGNPQLDYINAHGTATALNDIVESRAVKSVFGNSVAISSTKALTNHWLGAAGAVETILCLQAMREDFLPPTLHLSQPDADCDLDYVPNVGREANIKYSLNLSYGFGGHIGALILQKAGG